MLHTLSGIHRQYIIQAREVHEAVFESIATSSGLFPASGPFGRRRKGGGVPGTLWPRGPRARSTTAFFTSPRAGQGGDIPSRLHGHLTTQRLPPTIFS